MSAISKGKFTAVNLYGYIKITKESPMTATEVNNWVFQGPQDKITNRDVNCLLRTEIYEMKYDVSRVCFRIRKKFKTVSAFALFLGELMGK